MRWSDITLCYLMLLNRMPTDHEVAEGQSKGVADLLSSVVSQRDFLRAMLFAYLGADSEGVHGSATKAFYDFVEDLGADRLQALHERILAIPRNIQNGHDYVAVHCRRMVELMGFLERRHRDHPIESILDVGNSPFFALYPELFPGIKAYLVDLCPPLPDYIKQIGAQEAFKVDLNRGCISQAAGGPVSRTFDVIVFTEVIEHIFVSPVEALKDLMALLSPGGVIYFSTPNYFKASTIARVLDRVNPQQSFSRSDVANQGSHYHLREYTFYELRDAVFEAGGELEQYAFSDCWDRSDYSEEMQKEFPIPVRSNLVLIIRKATDRTADRHSGQKSEISGNAARAVVDAFTVDLDQLVDVDISQPVVNLDRLTFDEQWYLKMNRDVAEAVREGVIESGWDHYINYGRVEGRPIRRRLVRVRES